MRLLLQLVLLLVLSFYVGIGSAWGLTLEEIPNPRFVYGGWISDRAEILSPETEVRLNQQISQLESRTGNELAVVTVPEITPLQPVRSFALNLFNRWGIGKREENNGLLLFVDLSEHRVEIITGQGIQEVWSDRAITQLIRQQMLPAFQENHYEQAILQGVEALIDPLYSDMPSTISNFSGQKLWLAILIFVGMCGVFWRLTRPRSSPIIVPPDGQSEGYFPVAMKPRFVCSTCNHRMKVLSDSEREAWISPAMKVALELGSIHLAVISCTHCHKTQSNPLVHLRRYRNNRQYQECPECQEYTAEAKKIVIKRPTTKKQGKQNITLRCRACDFTHTYSETLPVIKPSSKKFTNKKRSSNSSSIDDNYFLGSSGSYSGGSNFGGGYSDGGGGGDSW